jgi:2-polyprenyl-3-methyl-5-hydroxy-6-metoxy-1,4-benzoquinol methylase
MPAVQGLPIDLLSIDARVACTETLAMDNDKRALFALQVWGYKQGEVVAYMIHVGDQLGLYRAMRGAGPLTAEELAARTDLDTRWLLEWLRSQGAAGLLETDQGDRFELSEEGAEILANEESSLWFASGAFHGGVMSPDVTPRLLDAFRTGAGLSYDDLGPSAAHSIERMLAPWTRLVLVPVILPRLSGVVDKLHRGARVADVGCGGGVALESMAAAFPDSSFEGYDPSGHAIERAKGRMAAADLSNVTLHLASAADLPTEQSYDLVLTLDCIHDMAHPAEAMRAIRRSVRSDGTWLIKDIRAAATWADNLKNPMLALMYGTSVTMCLSSALSEPGGAGLGTLGLYPELAQRMCHDAGFTSFTLHDFDDPADLYYEVRP